jgi:galactosylceramidase
MTSVKITFHYALPTVVLLFFTVCGHALASQLILLDGSKSGEPFDGVGAVSGGGATSVLLKDYPPLQRDQILDILFKPDFAASMQTLYVEIGGDGNSTQGTEPTHMRSRSDENYSRGYEWWLMTEAKKRNPSLTLDACAWSAPAWVGDGQFWSQDMADYYVKWVKGLHDHYGLDLNAIGCRNEKGANVEWVKRFRKTLDSNGLSGLPIHGFDNPGQPWMWDWIAQLESDKELQSAVAITSNHCLTATTMPVRVRDTIRQLHKTVWNTEEHVYNEGPRRYADAYDAALGAVHLFNLNYIDFGATKIINWYLVGSTYPCEPYADQPPAMFAQSPWSGHYQIKPIIWSYAHYGQFVKVGWHYMPSACTKLSGGGSVVSMQSSDQDYSLIAETSDATQPQQVRFKVIGPLSKKGLCVWRTNRREQFIRQSDVVLAPDGSFQVTLEPQAIYSLSTTAGQQKGSFDNVPADEPFPLPYFDNFDHYGNAATRGYLPGFTADIVGVFELSDRSDHKGQCLRQVVGRKANSWAPEWKPYTVIGDDRWTDYEISADVLPDDRGWAGVMGRVTQTGNGWDDNPEGYYCRLYNDGGVQLFSAASHYGGSRDREIGFGKIEYKRANGSWHNLKMRFKVDTISVLVDDHLAVTVQDSEHTHGLAGLIAAGEGTDRSTACFDNLLINKIGNPIADPRRYLKTPPAIYETPTK